MSDKLWVVETHEMRDGNMTLAWRMPFPVTFDEADRLRSKSQERDDKRGFKSYWTVVREDM